MEPLVHAARRRRLPRPELGAAPPLGLRLIRAAVVVLAATLLGGGCGGNGRGSPDLAYCAVGGHACDPVLGCADAPGCNWCRCIGSSAACTQVACFSPDGGVPTPPACHADADCESGRHCLFDPGCTSDVGRCIADAVCDPMLGGSATSFCDCAGHTVAERVTCGVHQPYQHVGPCG